jgi:hypothetical protein
MLFKIFIHAILPPLILLLPARNVMHKSQSALLQDLKNMTTPQQRLDTIKM